MILQQIAHPNSKLEKQCKQGSSFQKLTGPFLGAFFLAYKHPKMHMARLFKCHDDDHFMVFG